MSGDLGGGQDDGVDGFYLLADGTIVSEDSYTPKSNVVLDLLIIQVTTSAKWSETKVHKLSSFMRHLLEWESLDNVNLINQRAKDAMMMFRTVYEKTLGKSHTLNVHLIYVTRSENAPSTGIVDRMAEVELYTKSKLSESKVFFEPWGAAKLLKSTQTVPDSKLLLEKSKHFDMPDASVVCLCTVSNFAKFLDDGSGKLRTWLMEPNVRDYQGSNPVNKQIRATLEKAVWTEDFWWLNNGITILSDKCSVTGNRVSVENPEIVNGLQTSYEIFNARANQELEKRHVLVKIIVAPENSSKNAITKATNSQTSVNALSLKSNDPIQFAIEDKLLNCGLYYDRRKGKHRRLQRPISKMVSMKELGQAIIAAFLQRPSDARARPDSLLSNEKVSPTIYGENYSLDFFASCILLDRQCRDFVNASDLAPDAKTDVRFYLTTMVARKLSGKLEPSVVDIAGLITNVTSPIDSEILRTSLDYVVEVYNQFGGNDKTAKGRQMQEFILL